jgi:hypothetical protein
MFGTPAARAPPSSVPRIRSAPPRTSTITDRLRPPTANRGATLAPPRTAPAANQRQRAEPADKAGHLRHDGDRKSARSGRRVTPDRNLIATKAGLAARSRPRGYFLLRRWIRVFFSSLRCFFFAIRLRRFLMTEPIRPPSSAQRQTGTPSRSPGTGGWAYARNQGLRERLPLAQSHSLPVTAPDVTARPVFSPRLLMTPGYPAVCTLLPATRAWMPGKPYEVCRPHAPRCSRRPVSPQSQVGDGDQPVPTKAARRY